jgi:hypothetical protein
MRSRELAVEIWNWRLCSPAAGQPGLKGLPDRGVQPAVKVGRANSAEFPAHGRGSMTCSCSQHDSADSALMRTLLGKSGRFGTFA